MDDEELAEHERSRLRALVAADLVAANALHAADFQLVTPGGETISKEQYLAGVASREIDYRRWEPETIESRVCGDAGCVRYRSTIEIAVDGRELGVVRCWHTDYYEHRDGRWQVVFSQATATS
jgi:hypothetical protein